MISSAPIAGWCLLIVATQVDPALRVSPAHHTPPIMPKKAVAARIVQVIRVDAPADALMMPTDVAVGGDDVIYVADGVNDRVVTFDANGSYSGELSAIGDVTLNNPIGLAIDADNRIWITDNGNHRVVRVSANRQSADVIAFDIPGAKPDAEPIDPTGIVVSPDGARTFVVDNDHHHLLIRDNATGYLQRVGEGGASLGQLQWPFLAALDSDGTLFVTEAIGARVQRLDRQLQWTGAIGGWGVGEGQLYRPKGIAIDADSRVLVSDSTLGAVQVFTSRGRFIGVMTEGAGQLIRFAHPMGMAIDGAGRLLVVEAGANQISVVEFITVDDDEGHQ